MNVLRMLKGDSRQIVGFHRGGQSGFASQGVDVHGSEFVGDVAVAGVGDAAAGGSQFFQDGQDRPGPAVESLELAQDGGKKVFESLVDTGF